MTWEVVGRIYLRRGKVSWSQRTSWTKWTCWILNLRSGLCLMPWDRSRLSTTGKHTYATDHVVVASSGWLYSKIESAGAFRGPLINPWTEMISPIVIVSFTRWNKCHLWSECSIWLSCRSFHCIPLHPSSVRQKPCLFIWTQFEDHNFRLYQANWLTKMADRLVRVLWGTSSMMCAVSVLQPLLCCMFLVI